MKVPEADEMTGIFPGHARIPQQVIVPLVQERPEQFPFVRGGAAGLRKPIEDMQKGTHFSRTGSDFKMHDPARVDI
ncbi:MAG: hypothetical protein ACRECY_15755 [Phyllobacterium sp.]